MAEKETVIPVGPGADEDIREESDERTEERGQEATDEGGEEARSEDDERTGHSDESEDDREAIRSRRRAEKHRKKENRQRERLELGFLRQRNEQLERRQSEMDARISQGELVSIDSKISELDGQIREAERIHSIAVKNNDGDNATEALRIAAELRAGRQQLVAVKSQRINAMRQPTRPTIDPAIAAEAERWASSHDWYDTNLRNEESRIAYAIENQVASEGRLDPRTRAYWEEVDRRARKYLPDLYGESRGRGRDRDDENDEEDEEQEDPPARRKPKGPRITTGGRERPLRKNEVYISAERKEAMIEAGVWNDPVLREKYLKQYQAYDREHRVRS